MASQSSETEQNVQVVTKFASGLGQLNFSEGGGGGGRGFGQCKIFFPADKRSRPIFFQSKSGA